MESIQSLAAFLCGAMDGTDDIESLFYSRIERVLVVMNLQKDEWVLQVAKHYIERCFETYLTQENRTIIAILELIPLTMMVACKVYFDIPPFKNSFWAKQFPPLVHSSKSLLAVVNDRERHLWKVMDYQMLIFTKNKSTLRTNS